jgi:hypothetical protein
LYGKVFNSIYDGTLAGHWEAIVTMQQFIVLATPDGIVDMTPEAIAGRTTIPLDIIKKGISFLEKPDPYTRTPGEDGKRIVLLDGHRPWGWRLVNHGKYMRLRNMEQKREADRTRISEKRLQNNDVAIVSQMSPDVANVAHSDSDSDRKRVERSQGSRLSPDWFPSSPLTDWATKERPDLDLPSVVARFKDYWGAVPGARARKTDWDATFRNFIRTEKPGSKRPATQTGEVI